MSLKRVLTLRTVVATSAGLTLSTSTFVAAIQTASFLSGDAAWLPILIGGILCLAAAACFSELNGILPSAAGIRLYFGRAFNEQLALTVSILYMVVIMGVVGAESFVLANALSVVFPSLPPLLWIVAMFLLVTVLNIRGIKIAGSFQDIITYGLLISLAAISFFAIQKLGFHLTAPLHISSAGGLIQAIAIGIFLFVGFEWVAPLAEEVTDSRLVSRGMLIAVGVLSITYALFTVAMTASVPREALVNSPIPQVIFARAVLGKAGLIWIVVISLAASITTFNAGLLSVSRFVYATAREHALPALFTKISLRYFTPWAAIILVFAVGLGVSVVVLFTGRYLALVNLAAAMESVVYLLVGLAVIRLRKDPLLSQRQTYRAPGGLLLPVLTSVVFAVLAVAVCFTSWQVGLSLVVGLLVCWWYVRKIVPVIKKKYQTRRGGRRQRSTETNL